MKNAYVYILASNKNGTLYVGVTSDLLARVGQHKACEVAGFTRTHKVDRLVYYEHHDDIEQALIREKRLKKWKRAWKIELIEKDNPYWFDLYPRLLAHDGFPLSRE